MLKSAYEHQSSRRFFQEKLPLDPGIRRMIHGPIRPMEEPGLLSRIFHWR